MTQVILDEEDDGLILAAEECPPERFEKLHFFSSHDDLIIRKLVAHGPVLVRGGRGSGKSALLIEAHRRIRAAKTVFSVYMSLRYLPLLQSDGSEYIKHFCSLLANEVQKELVYREIDWNFPAASDQMSIQIALAELSQYLDKRIVILFDDAAHIGREKPLEVFFDLFRTLSSNTTSCKASIYPGVTRFGTRFDVFNDSTVVDISRSDVSSGTSYFLDVLKTRYPNLSARDRFSDRLSPEQFSNLIGRAVVGNMRGFILACNNFENSTKIGIPEVSNVLVKLAEVYFWPLMEEVAPKLGVYEPMIAPAQSIFELVVDSVIRPVKTGQRNIAQDRVTIHRDLVAKFSKAFEILEYLGFVSKREASRSMKSGGRGPVFAINLCSILEQIPSKRLTIEMSEEWTSGKLELAEIHSSGNIFNQIVLPSVIDENAELGILKKPIKVLAKSPIYPYGLTTDKLNRLETAGLSTVGELAKCDETKLLEIDGIGVRTVTKIHNVVMQAIWM